MARLGPCPVDRVSKRRRNQICLLIIAIGAVNFIAYTVSYAVIGGDAHNGNRRLITGPDGTQIDEYTIRGHFIRDPVGTERPVSRSVWIYSYLHSITVPLTSGAMVISMLILARPHIVATMSTGPVRGIWYIRAFGLIVILLTAGMALFFAWDFVVQMRGTS